jgi:hypothetical protein
VGKVTINLNGKLGRLIKEGPRKPDLQEAGEIAIVAIKKLIASGTSPVDGFGRYEAYGSQRNKVKGQKSKGYPLNVQKDFPNKKVRPVNLFLSGELMEALEFQVKFRLQSFKTKLSIGFFGNISKSLREKIDTAQNGNALKNIPQRKILPGPGEAFTISIQRAIKNALVESIKKSLK